MSRSDRQKIAQETIKITKSGKYKLGAREVSLGNQDFAEVVCLSPEETDQLMSNRIFFTEKAYHAEKTSYYVVDGDSFEAARTYCKGKALVMNFASAKHPGGGFETGASAQEESLCRASTLYASLSSEKAAEMYEYNLSHLMPAYSDYMLLSDNVAVFRDPDGTLLQKPYYCGVITVPAPNRNGGARKLSQKEIDEIAAGRLRRMLSAAAYYGYRELVLGAWGCGVFGNRAENIAGYFRHLLIDEDMHKYFDRVIFAIYRDDAKLKVFRETFHDV